MRTNELHFKILIPVWGETYLKRFFDICSKSLFSESNLLLLKNFKSSEIVFLTTKDSEIYIRSYFLSKDLNVKISYIDDLLGCNSYGIILTLAYTRGILTSNTNQLDTAFMFLNADLLLSNNTTSLIINQLNAGYDGVLALGMRCIEEEVSELIEKSDLSSRELVDICFKHMHPTMSANIINQDFCYSTNNLAIHLKTESSCLLTISFNPYMLCIKPEVELKYADGYCDFYFVPAMLPSGNFYYVCDSDEMFMLEIAPEQQERDFICYSSITNKKVSNWLSLILMKDKLKYANYINVMHTNDIQENLNGYKNLIKNYFDISISALPKDYFETYSKYDAHPFWLYPIMNAVENGHINPSLEEINIQSISNKMQEAGLREQQRQRLIEMISEKNLHFMLQHLFVKKVKNSSGITLFVTDSGFRKNSAGNNELYVNIREFLNLPSLKPVLSPVMIKDSSVIFIVSQSTFDFYRNKIKKFIRDYGGFIKIKIHLKCSAGDRDIFLKYIPEILFDISGVFLNICPVSEVESMSHTFKLRILRFLAATLKFCKNKIYRPMVCILRRLELYAPRFVVCFLSSYCQKLKYKVKGLMGTMNQNNPVVIDKYEITIYTNCPANPANR